MKLRFFFTVLILLLAASCSKKDNNSALEAKLIIGEWHWVSSFSCWSFNTPESTGNNIRLSFDVHGLFEIFTNGVLTDRRNYIITTEYVKPDSKPKVFLKSQSTFFFQHQNMNFDRKIHFEGQDTLYLNSGTSFGSSYVRKK